MRSLFLAAVFTLTACATPEVAEPDYMRTLKGACANGLMDACVAVAEIEAQDRQRQMQASANLMQAGAALQQIHRPVQQPRLRTTCTQMGSFLNCF